MKRLIRPLIILVCIVAIVASIFDVHCTVAINTSGVPAAFVLCGGVWRWSGQSEAAATPERK